MTDEEGFLEYHEGETWLIEFVAHDVDGAVLPLPTGTTATFLLTNLGETALTAESPADITFTDAPHGEGEITITTTMQGNAGLDHTITYRYWLRIVTPTLVTLQDVGKFHIKESPF